METVFEEVATDSLWIVQVALVRIENGLLRLQGITTVIEGCHEVRYFDIGEVQSEDIDTWTLGLH